MNEILHGSLLRYVLTSFVTLLVVVDPFGIVPVFAGLTATMDNPARQKTLNRAMIIGFGISLFFLIAGRAALGYLGVTVDAFAISGGILLFATALPMLFGQRAGLQSSEPGEPADTDIAVFPLAIPLLSGPGSITTILLLTSQAGGSVLRLGLLVAATGLVFVVSWLVLKAGTALMARVGESGAHVATRILGVVLAALAVQFVLNGVTGYLHGARVH